jgi:RNA polymerase sigma-70 factor, ECF subfamily
LVAASVDTHGLPDHKEVQMGFDNYFEGIDEYAAQLIGYKARMLIGHYGFTESDREDLEQELKLDLLKRLSKYDPDRAQLHTFISRLIDHEIASIIEAREAGMRDYRLCTCSLNDTVEDKEGSMIERQETIDQEDCLFLTGRISRSQDELHDLSLDIERVMKRLPPELSELCQRLKIQTKIEISRDTGTPRGKINDNIRKLRIILRDSGFRDYL